MKNRFLSIVLAFCLLFTVAPITFVSAADLANVEVGQSGFILNAKAVLDTQATEDITAYIRKVTIDDGAETGVSTQVYGIAQADEAGALVDAKYEYTFSFTMYQDDQTGKYRIYFGGGLNGTKDFDFISPMDKVNFYNDLNDDAATEIYDKLTGVNSKTSYDLTSYKALPAAEPDIRGLVDTEIAAWDLSATLGTISEVETTFATKMDEVIVRAEFAVADPATFNDKVAAAGANIDTTYYGATDAPSVSPDVVAGYMDSASLTDLTYASLGVAFDKAVLLAVAEEMDYLTLNDAYLYFRDKDIVSLDADKLATLESNSLVSSLFSELKLGTYATVGELEEEADDIADRLIDGLSDPPKPNRPIISGGGSVIVPQKPPVVPTETPEDNTDNSTYNGKFSDMNGHWASEAVEYLAAKNVIAGRSEGRFVPDDSVTREEFVKMVVMAFNCLDEAAECDFNDVDKTVWSYRYIASAIKAGYINGEDEYTFNPEGVITREQMAAIVYRAIDNKIASEDSGMSFTDSENISDYAQEAVKMLASMGIINGMGNGSFMPKANVTRAQAAKVLFETIK